MESEGEQERVAVVHKRACSEFHSRVSEKVLEKGLAEKMVDLSGDEGEHWCEVLVSVLASVPLVLCRRAVEAVPEAVRNRPTPQGAAFAAVPGWEQSTASTRRNAIAADCDVARPSDGSMECTSTKAQHQNGELPCSQEKYSRWEPARSISCSVMHGRG